MNEELKLVISKINNKLGTDFNIISINSLSNIEILQLINKVLNNFGICSLVRAEENLELTVFIILEALQKIKYVPPNDVTPEEFREGLLNGNFKIFISLLSWILQDEEEIAKRVYLSKYVEKIEVPPEILSDPNVQSLYQNYEAKIEEFWKTYSQYKKEKKNEEETNELKKDIERMDFDLQKLIQRTNSQREKVESIPNYEILLSEARTYTKEMMEEKKLQEQLLSLQTTLNQTENQIKALNESISIKKSSKTFKNKPLEYLESEFNTNKLLAEEELPKEYEKLNLELSLLETVLNEPEPTEEEIQGLSEEIEKIQLQIQGLNEKKLTLLHANNDVLRPYQNQATIVENKKNELTKTVMEMKMNLEELNRSLTEKHERLVSYVGGPILHGDELRKYVAHLRELSVTYKEKKGELQALVAELSVLNRTSEVLSLIDPNIPKILEEKEDREIKSNVFKNEKDEEKLRAEFLQLVEETNKKQEEVKIAKEQLANVREEFELVNEKYQTAKEDFERITGYKVNELEKYYDEVRTTEEEIETLEEKWKTLRREIDRKEDILLKLSEDLVNSANGDEEDDEGIKEPTQLQKLEMELREKEKIMMELKDKQQAIPNRKNEHKEQLEIMNGIIQIINCKQRLLNNQINN